MTLANIWFFLVALLLTGYVDPRRLRPGRRRALPVPRQDGGGQERHPRLDRPRLGRQRGLAAHRRRRHLRRLPDGVRHDLLRLLPRDHARALRPHPARRVARVPAPRLELERRLGRRLLPRQPRAVAARRGRPRQRHPRRPHGRAGQLHRDLPGAAQPVLAARRGHRAVPARTARRGVALRQVGGRAPRPCLALPQGDVLDLRRARRGDVARDHPHGLARVGQRVRAVRSAGCSWSSSSWACSTRSGR